MKAKQVITWTPWLLVVTDCGTVCTRGLKRKYMGDMNAVNLVLRATRLTEIGRPWSNEILRKYAVRPLWLRPLRLLCRRLWWFLVRLYLRRVSHFSCWEQMSRMRDSWVLSWPVTFLWQLAHRSVGEIWRNYWTPR